MLVKNSTNLKYNITTRNESLKKYMYSQLPLRRTLTAGPKGVRLIESQIKGVKERKGPTLGVCFREVSVL